MICISCGRAVDPTRSFCTNCGSAVFGDDPRRSRLSIAPPALKVPPRRKQAESSSAPSPVRRSASSFPLAGFVRLLIFGLIVWWVGNALLAFPEMRLVWDQIKRGDTPNFEPAINRLKESAGIPVEHATSPQPPARGAEPRQPEREPLPEAPNPAASAPPEGPRAALPSAPPAGVYLPGNGVTTPRVTERQLPSYTREARLQRIEGVVRLRGVVQPDGSISNIEVVQSLDPQYGLDQAAMTALGQWRFTPGIRNGRPVPVLVYIDLTFKLR